MEIYNPCELCLVTPGKKVNSENSSAQEYHVHTINETFQAPSPQTE